MILARSHQFYFFDWGATSLNYIEQIILPKLLYVKYMQIAGQNLNRTNNFGTESK